MGPKTPAILGSQANAAGVKPRVLVSVTNKTGLEQLHRLHVLGWEIISTGGTGKELARLAIPFTHIEEITNFPEILDGRVKTLHPHVFAAILANRDVEAHMDTIRGLGIAKIDMVIVNLYEFENKPGIENIDVGGPSLIRAAAKNCHSVTVIVDPEDYDHVFTELEDSKEVWPTTRQRLATQAFEHTCEYDAAIARWYREQLATRTGIPKPELVAH